MTLNDFKVIKKIGQPFRVWYWGHEHVVMPMEYLVDVKRAGRGHLDFVKSIQDVSTICV
jgi:hypothetical protein